MTCLQAAGGSTGRIANLTAFKDGLISSKELYSFKNTHSSSNYLLKPPEAHIEDYESNVLNVNREKLHRSTTANPLSENYDEEDDQDNDVVHDPYKYEITHNAPTSSRLTAIERNYHQYEHNPDSGHGHSLGAHETASTLSSNSLIHYSAGSTRGVGRWDAGGNFPGSRRHPDSKMRNRYQLGGTNSWRKEVLRLSFLGSFAVSVSVQRILTLSRILLRIEDPFLLADFVHDFLAISCPFLF